MNSHQKSVGNKIPIIIFSLGQFCRVALCLGLGLSISCAGPNEKGDGPPEMTEEISLKADRSDLSELRSEIPEEKKVGNDEEALLLRLTGELKEHPSRVRDKWSQLTRKKRDDHRNNVKKLRDDFTSSERDKRKDHLQKMTEERDSFKRTKVDREETKRFFAEQDRERKDFFAEERDRRKDFESKTRAQSKEFEDYMRQRDKQFGERHRDYSKRWQEKDRAEREAKREAQKDSSLRGRKAVAPKGADASILKDFEDMKALPGSPLGAGSDDGK